VGVWLSARRGRAGQPQPERPARLALAVAAGYIVVMIGANQAARAVVAEGLARAGRPADTRFMVSPVPVNPFEREVVVDVGDRYEKGVVWFEPLPHFRPSGFGMGHGLTDPLVQQALDTPVARDFLVWSRFPFATIDASTSPARVWMNDYRYANTGSGGWSATDVSRR
jgi:inner membrane protein